MSSNETAFIGLGSNEGDRTVNIEEAVRRIGETHGINLLAVSPLYETSPVDVNGGPFINAVAMIETKKDPRHLMDDLLRIESEMGRVRSGSLPMSRAIDIDLLLYGERVIGERGLSLPHPRMADRRFVLEPLADLAADLRIPVSGRTVAETAAILKDRHPEQKVERVGNLKEFSSLARSENAVEQP